MTDDEPESRLRFAALCFRDQFLLWSVRAWITESAGGPHMPRRVEEAFDAAGLAEARQTLHELLTIIGTRAHRTVRFRPIGCVGVADEEARFLTLMAAARCRESDAYALDLLMGWLPPHEAMRALPLARDLALKAAERLPAPGPGAHPPPAGPTPVEPTSPDPGLSLIH